MKTLKITFLLVALMGIFATQNTYAQQEENQVYTAPETKPQYPGGEAALMQYIASAIQYPTMAINANVQGRVVVQFIVEKDGRIGEVKVVRGQHPALDAEVVRAVKNIPEKFIPGKVNGKIVRCFFALPINFKLPPAEIENKE